VLLLLMLLTDNPLNVFSFVLASSSPYKVSVTVLLELLLLMLVTNSAPDTFAFTLASPYNNCVELFPVPKLLWL